MSDLRQLNGTKPLWPTIRQYLNWIHEHHAEIRDYQMLGDENADLIILSLMKLAISVNKSRPEAVLMVATERYLASYHPKLIHDELARQQADAEGGVNRE